MILVVGPPGAGKSTFCQHVALKSLAALKEQGWREVEPGLLSFVDAYNETVGVSVMDRLDTVYADCNSLSSIDIAISRLRERVGRTDILLVFDSLTSPYLFSGSEILRLMTQTLSRFAAEGNAVLTCIDEGCGKSEDFAAMMSLANGVVRMTIEEDKQLLHVVKHPTVRTTKIEVLIEPERLGIVSRVWEPSMLKQFFQASLGGEEAFWRRQIGDYVHLFWPNLVPWSGMLWDPKRFPKIFYEANKDDMPAMVKLCEEDKEVYRALPWRMRLLWRLMVPKSFSKVKDTKKMVNAFVPWFKQERSGIIEYVDDISKTDEHYIRIYENFNCWGFENVGDAMASYLPAMIAGYWKGLEYYKGLDRDWNAIETKCIGLGDPYCEIKLVPGEIDELEDTLEKDVSVLERIHNNLMHRLMGFLLHGKPLVERPKLGSDVYLHPVNHTMGGENIPAMARVWSERYQMALRMGGAKAGKEVGEHLMNADIREDEAVRRILHLLEHCKVGKIAMDETLRIRENCENVLSKLLPTKLKEPSCYFTTGFLNGVFSAIKNQHVRETRCIAMGDPYCEWEFR